MSIFRIRSVSAAVIATLSLGACTDPATAPPSPSTALATALRPARDISNAVKYRDAGQRPATGRSGSATLTVSALLGMTGLTTIDIAAGAVNGASDPLLAKVQLVGYSPTGGQLFTLNDNHLSAGSTTFSLA